MVSCCTQIFFTQISKNTASAAKRARRTWNSDSQPLVQRSSITRYKKVDELPEFVVNWIKDHTAPSSNSKNVVSIVEKDEEGEDNRRDHVIHWRTESIPELFKRCKLEVMEKFGNSISQSYFYSCVPPYVRMKKHQDGLCPIHHTGLTMEKELQKLRARWHQRCHCVCDFCSEDGCAHGATPEGEGKCSSFTCKRCRNVRCSKEYTPVPTTWSRPVQQRRKGGGIYWVNEEERGSRQQCVEILKEEALAFNQHHRHVLFHKDQMRHLLDNFREDQMVISCDFIQNIVHSRGRETSQSYYGKRQTQMLAFTIWYYAKEEGEMVKTKLHVDYLSSYLKHNSLFFQKCLVHLLTYLRDEVRVNFNKVCFRLELQSEN